MKKCRKVAIDANEQFAGIEQVIATQTEVAQRQALWDQQDRVKEARQQAELLIQKGMMPCLHEFHVLDAVNA